MSASNSLLDFEEVTLIVACVAQAVFARVYGDRDRQRAAHEELAADGVELRFASDREVPRE